MVKVTPLDAKIAQTNEELSHEPLNLSRYQTKKSIAQGMLDISLLTANISQLKYVLQVGHKHEFYTLLIMLLSVVIFLQMSTGVLNLSMNLLNDCNVNARHTTNNKPNAADKSSNVISFIVTGSSFLVVVINLLISAFDPTILRYIEMQ
ncbi:ninjurin-1-like [Culicoides brevitarsis]|uniref:ninjurin-1-like n=1 Tax=Culicoides brevitarsis TaxID=469753 RepID=UPI00307C1276